MKKLSLLITILFMFCSSNLFADTWSLPANISAVGNDASLINFAVSDDGTKVTAIWKRLDGTNSRAQTASGTISGGEVTWGSTTTLSDSGYHARGIAIAVSGDGTKAVAVWTRDSGINSNVTHAATATISGNVATWSSTQDISSATGLSSEISVAMSSDGSKVTAIWLSNSYGAVRTASATVATNVASWGTVTDLSASTGTFVDSPKVAISSDGLMATAIWTKIISSLHNIQTASASISGNTASWSSTSTLNSVSNCLDPSISMSTNGQTVVATWYRSSDDVYAAAATVSGNTANWGTDSIISDSALGGNEAEIQISSDGTLATAIWNTGDSPRVLHSRSATVSGNSFSWGNISSFKGSGTNPLYPSLALSADGDLASVAWIENDASHQLIRSSSASVFGNNATWGPVTILSDAGQHTFDPFLTASSNGLLAVAGWSRSNGTNLIVQAASALITPPPTYTPTATATNTFTTTPTHTATHTATASPSVTNIATNVPTIVPTTAPTITQTPSPKTPSKNEIIDSIKILKQINGKSTDSEEAIKTMNEFISDLNFASKDEQFTTVEKKLFKTAASQLKKLLKASAALKKTTNPEKLSALKTKLKQLKNDSKTSLKQITSITE